MGFENWIRPTVRENVPVRRSAFNLTVTVVARSTQKRFFYFGNFSFDKYFHILTCFDKFRIVAMTYTKPLHPQRHRLKERLYDTTYR